MVAAPRPRSRIRFAAIALVVVCALAAALAGYWWALTERLKASTLATIETLRGQGYAVTFANLSRSGFPLDARLDLTRPNVQVRAPGSAWGWAADRATVRVSLLAPTAATLQLSGRQALALRSGATYTGTAKEISMRLAAGGWLPVGTLSISGLIMQAAGDGAAGDGAAGGGDGFGVGRLDAEASGDPAAPAATGGVGYRLTARAAGLRLPKAADLPLGEEIAQLTLEAAVIGALRPAPWPAELGQWRDRGGVIELGRLALVHGPLAATGQGTLALDARFQPIGAVSLEIRGYQQGIAALRERRVINADTADTLSMVLTGMARPGADGTSVLKLPLTLQDRTVSAGPLPVARLPEIRWSSPSPARFDTKRGIEAAAASLSGR